MIIIIDESYYERIVKTYEKTNNFKLSFVAWLCATACAPSEDRANALCGSLLSSN